MLYLKQALLILAILIGLPIWLLGVVAFVLAAWAFMWVDRG